jgi:CBS domain-containing protein
VVVDTGDGLGIVTDRDIRTRVVAAGAAPDTPLSDVMTAPAWTVSADRTGTEALLEMLDHDIRHLPVLSAGRRLLGVLDDVDLMANERRAPFHLRAAIARSSDAKAVAEAAAELPDMVIALFDAGLASGSISRAITSIHDAATRRLIEFAHADLGRPPVPYTWLGTGSFGRFEPFPSSDVDSAIAWDGPDDDMELRRGMELFSALRMEHQVAQLREGEAPDNLIDPRSLTTPVRASLKEAFRAVAGVQRRVAPQYGLHTRQ